MAFDACSDPNCKHRPMALFKYRKMRAERWGTSFAIQLGRTATKMYVAIYKSRPPRGSNGGGGIGLFPCGIIERAYHDVRAQGVPLRKPLGPIGRARLEKRVASRKAQKTGQSGGMAPPALGSRESRRRAHSNRH